MDGWDVKQLQLLLATPVGTFVYLMPSILVGASGLLQNMSQHSLRGA